MKPIVILLCSVLLGCESGLSPFKQPSKTKIVGVLGSGVLQVSSTPPGADVYIDGKKVGTTPDSVGQYVSINVDIGEHELKLKKIDEECQKTISVYNGQTISEDIALGNWVEQVIESAHWPYKCPDDYTWPIAKSGAASIRVHFARVEIFSEGDYVEVTNGSSAVNTYGAGTSATDFYSDWVTGNTIGVRFYVPDGSATMYYGFKIDGYEYK